MFKKNITRFFLRGSSNRRTPQIAATTTKSVTPSPKRILTPTAASRGNYLTRTTTKSLESQENTTPKPKSNRFEYVSGRPPFLRKTIKPKVSYASNILTQKDEKIHASDSIGKPLELRDVVVALQNLQNAPLPTERVVEEKNVPKNTGIEYFPEQAITTMKTLILTNLPNLTDKEIIFTTSLPKSRFKTTPKIIFNKVTITPPTKEYSTVHVSVPQKLQHQPTTHTIAHTNSFISESYPYKIANRIHPPSTLRPYSDPYDKYQPTHLNYNVRQPTTLEQLPEQSNVLLHSNGLIECLDQGNFPHPIFCKRFISCAKMENGKMIGWEYTCPKNLSFDPIGGICNWSADLGCDEN